MSDKRVRLSRRKLLAGLGSVGLASAGAGVGTTALFADEESVEGNSLTAGTLDLKVDWEEHYYNGNAPDPGSEDIDSLRLVDSRDDVGDDEVGLPDPDDPVVAVPGGDLAEFMNKSTLESGGPTNNPDPGRIELTDVKPGDFGEVTYSYHLSGNPGYVRLEAEEIEDAENGVNEPEASADDEDDPQGSDSSDGTSGELGDAIQAALWYDPDCDNVLDDGMETVLKRGTLNEVMDFLGNSGAEPPVLDPIESGGRVAEDYGGTDCHGTIGGPPLECSEKLYVTNTELNNGGYNQKDDTTKLYEVEITGSGNANLTELFDFTGMDFDGDDVGDYNHIVSMAASPEGRTIYVIDRYTNRLGEYDVVNDSFTDRGQISGAPIGSLQAAVSPAGRLYFTVYDEDKLYVIDDPDSSTTVDRTIPVTDRNGDSIGDAGGSDIAFLSNGTLFLVDGSANLYEIREPLSGNGEKLTQLQSDVVGTGLAVRKAGDGTLVFSEPKTDEIVEVDPSDGSRTGDRYPMKLGGNDFNHVFGDMTVGPLCPEHCVALAWWLPREVGNEVQSDSYKFDVTFRTEQCRNNDDPFGDTPLDPDTNQST